MRKKPEDLLAELEYLYKGYANTMRSATEPYRLAAYVKKNPTYVYNPEDSVIRESLLEHVGVLPVIATAFYPYINEPDVDLGRALVMLAIHDIGELKTGDINTFIKSTERDDEEQKAALILMNHLYHDLYVDVENQTSATAKFAKSIDKVSADVLDYLTPIDVTIRRFQHFAHIEPENMIETIINKKRPYMLWNEFMTDFHIMIINKFEEKLNGYLQGE